MLLSQPANRDPLCPQRRPRHLLRPQLLLWITPVRIWPSSTSPQTRRVNVAAPCLARLGVVAVPIPPGNPRDPGVLGVSEIRPCRCRGRIPGLGSPVRGFVPADAQACLAYLTKEPFFVPRDCNLGRSSRVAKCHCSSPAGSSHITISKFHHSRLSVLLSWPGLSLIPHDCASKFAPIKKKSTPLSKCSWDPSGRPSVFPAPPWGVYPARCHSWAITPVLLSMPWHRYWGWEQFRILMTSTV